MYTHEFEREQCSLQLGCSFLYHKPLHHTDRRTSVRWRSLTCFCPFCGSPNDPVFCLRLFHYLYALHIASVWGNIHVHVLALVLIVMEESGYQLGQIDNICWPVSPAHKYPQSTRTCPCIYLASGLLTPTGCKVHVEGASVSDKGLAGLRMQCLLSLCFLPRASVLAGRAPLPMAKSL